MTFLKRTSFLKDTIAHRGQPLQKTELPFSLQNRIRFLTFVAQKLIPEHQFKPQFNLLPHLQHQEVHMRFRIKLKNNF